MRPYLFLMIIFPKDIQVSVIRLLRFISRALNASLARRWVKSSWMKTLVSRPFASWHVFPLRFFLESITLPFTRRLANFTNMGIGLAGVRAVPYDEASDLPSEAGSVSTGVGEDEDEEAIWPFDFQFRFMCGTMMSQDLQQMSRVSNLTISMYDANVFVKKHWN